MGKSPLDYISVYEDLRWNSDEELRAISTATESNVRNRKGIGKLLSYGAGLGSFGLMAVSNIFERMGDQVSADSLERSMMVYAFFMMPIAGSYLAYNLTGKRQRENLEHQVANDLLDERKDSCILRMDKPKRIVDVSNR